MPFETIINRTRQRLVYGMQTAGGENKELPDLFTRHIGGEYRKNQPFITGFHQVLFRLPEKLFGDEAEMSQKWLMSTCESFTPHTITPNFVDVMGQGQIGASFFASKTVGREFTCAFREYQNLPVMSVIDTWHGLFDQHVGTSPLQGDEYIPINYKGQCIVFQLKPTGAREDELTQDDFEEFYAYQGVFPKTNPRDTVGASDQTANDTIQLSVTFSFDGAPFTMKDEFAFDRVLEMLNSKNQQYITTYNKYAEAFQG